jgi:hypothetical protein
MLLESLPGEDLVLQPERTVLHAPPDLAQLIRMGEPVLYDAFEHARLAGKPLAPEIELLRGTSSFWLVRVPLTIRPRPETNVRFLAVEVELSGPDDATTCWSLDPERVDDETKVATKVSLSGKLTVKAAEIGANDEVSQEYVVRQPQILAFNAGRDDPAWEFTPTPGTALQGVQLLHLVVKSPVKGYWTGTVSIRADIVTRRVLWNVRAFRSDGQKIVAIFRGGAPGRGTPGILTNA